MIDGVNNVGEPITTDKYGKGSVVITNPSGQETVYHDPNVERRKASVVNYAKSKKGVLDIDDMEQSLNLYNMKPYYDEDEFNSFAKEYNLNEDQTKTYKDFLKNFPNYYERKIANGIYASESISRAHNSDYVPAESESNSLLYGQTKYTTRDILAEDRGFFFDKKGYMKPLADRKYYNHLKIVDSPTSGPTLQEIQDGEIVSPENIYTAFGARTLESNYLGSIGRGGINAVLGFGNYGLGFASSIGYKISRAFNDTKSLQKKYLDAGYTPEAARYYADKEFEKNNKWARSANWFFNNGSYWSHKNLDEQTSMFSDDFDGNALVFGITDAAVQLIPTILSGMAGSLIAGGIKTAINATVKAGLKQFGEEGVEMLAKKGVKKFLTSNWAEAGSVFSSQLQGSATVGGIMMNELMSKGATMNDAFWGATTTAGITMFSENVFRWNLTNKLGFEMTEKLFKSVKPSEIKRIVNNEIDSELKLFGKESIKELSKTEKKGLIGNVSNKILGFRSNKMGRNILESLKDGEGLATAKVVLGASFEEGAEELIEGAGDQIQTPFLNSLIYSNAQNLVNNNNNIDIIPEKIDGVKTGNFVVKNDNGTELVIDQNTYNDHVKGIKIANEVLDGMHDINNNLNPEEAVYAFLGTLLSMGVLRYSGAIQTNADRINTAAQVAIESANNPDYEKKFEKAFDEFYGGLTEQEKHLADQLKDQVELFKSVIKKYGVDSAAVRSVLADDKTLLTQLSKEYVELDKRLQLKEKSKEEGFDWGNKEHNPYDNITSSEELDAAIDVYNKRISEYIDVKKNTTNIDGTPIIANKSLMYSRLHNSYHSYDETIESIARIEAERQAFGLSKEKKGDEESEWQKKYDEVYEKQKKINKEHGVLMYRELSDGILGLEHVDPNIKENFYSMLKESYDKLVSEIEEKRNNKSAEYSDKNELSFTENLNKLSESIKGEDKNAAVQDFVKAFDSYNKFKETLATTSPDAFKGETKARINSLITKSKGIFDKAHEILSKADTDGSLGYYTLGANNYNVEDSDLNLTDGNNEEIIKKLYPINEKDLRIQAFKNTLEQSIKDQEGTPMGTILNDWKDLIKNPRELTQGEAASYNDLLSSEKGPLELIYNMKSFINGHKRNDEIINNEDKTMHEHSSFALEEYDKALHYETEEDKDGNSKLEGIEDYINDIYDVINSIKSMINQTVGSLELQAANGNLQSIYADYSLISAVANRAGVGTKKTKAAIKRVNDHIKKFRKKFKLKKDTDFANQLYSEFQKIGLNPEQFSDRLAFLSEWLYPIQKEIIEIESELSQRLDDTLDELKFMQVSYSKERKGSVPFLLSYNLYDNNDVINDYSKTDLRGILSPDVIDKALDKIWGNGNPFNSGDKDVRTVFAYYITYLNRVNTAGLNKQIENEDGTIEKIESPTIKDMYYALSESTEEKLKLLQKYFKNPKGVSDEELLSLSTLYASSYEQIRSALHLLGFLTDKTNNKGLGPGEKSSDYEQLEMPNAINVLGYAGGGKTTQIIAEAFKAYMRLTGKEGFNKKIKYVGPSKGLISDFAKSVSGIFKDGQLSGGLTKDLTTDDISGIDILIIDEASVLNMHEFNHIKKITAENNTKVIFISDDAQIIQNKARYKHPHIYNKTERIKPVSIVYRSGMNMHTSFLNHLRSSIGNPEFKLNYTFSYYKRDGDDLDKMGGEFAENKSDVIDQFRKTVIHLENKFGRPLTKEDIALIVYNDDEYEKVIDAIGDQYSHLVKIVSLSEHEDRVVSGLKSNRVFVAIDFSDDSLFTDEDNLTPVIKNNLNANVKPRVAYTAASRITKNSYLMMVADDSIKKENYSIESKKEFKTNERDTIGKIHDNLNQNNLNYAMFKTMLGNYKYSVPESENLEPDYSIDREANITSRRSVLNYTDEETAELLKLIDSFGFKSFSTIDDFKKIADHVTSWEYIQDYIDESIKVSDDDSPKARQRNRLRAKMLRLAMQNVLLSSMFHKNDIETLNDLKQSYIWENLNKAIIEFETYINENGFNKKKLNQAELDERIKFTKNKLRSISVPLDIIDNTVNENNQSRLIIAPALTHNSFGGMPFALEFTGFYTDETGKKVPIVNIHDVTNQIKIGSYEKSKLGAYVALLNSKGIKVNLITVHQFRSPEGQKNYNYKVDQTKKFELLVSDLEPEIISASKYMGDPITSKEVNEIEATFPQLYQNPRYAKSYQLDIEGRFYEPGAIVKYKGNRDIVDSIVEYFDGKGIQKKIVLKSGEVLDSIEDLEQFNADDKDALFYENAKRHSKKLSQVTSSAYLPILADGMYDSEDIYSMNHPIIQARNDVINFISTRKFEHELDFQENYQVQGRYRNDQGNFSPVSEPYVLRKGVAIKLSDRAINAYLNNLKSLNKKLPNQSKVLKANAKSRKIFRELGLDIVGFLNPIDVGFKTKVSSEKSKMQSNTLFENEAKTEQYEKALNELRSIIKNNGLLDRQEMINSLAHYFDAIFSDSFTGDNYEQELVDLNINKALDLMLIELNKEGVINVKAYAKIDGSTTRPILDGWNDFVSIKTKLEDQGAEVGPLKYSGDMPTSKGVTKSNVAKVKSNKGEIEIFVRGAIFTEAMAKEVTDELDELEKTIIKESEEIAKEKDPIKKANLEKVVYEKINRSLAMQTLLSNQHAIIEEGNIKGAFYPYLRMKTVKSKEILVGRGGMLSELRNIRNAINILFNNAFETKKKSSETALFFPVTKDAKNTVTRTRDIAMPAVNVSTHVDYNPIIPEDANTDPTPVINSGTENNEDDESVNEVKGAYVIPEYIDEDPGEDPFDKTGSTDLLKDQEDHAANEIQRILSENVNINFVPQIEKNDINSLLNKGDLKYEDEITDESCLAYGGSFGFVPGKKWSIIKEFKGKSHAQGGIDISVGKNSVRIQKGNSDFKAKFGLIIKSEKSWENK